MKAKWFMAASVIALSACTAMDKMAGMGVVSQHQSTFDHATVIEVSPNSLYDPGSAWGTHLQLGARWTSAAPDYVALTLAYNSSATSANPAYLGFSGVDISVDGEASSFSTGQATDLSSGDYNRVSHTVYTASRNDVVIPYSLLERMVAAKDCRLRISTSKGYQDALFSADHIPGGKATAITSIRDFMAKVDAARGGQGTR